MTGVLFGLLLTIAMLAGAIWLGGAPGAFVNGAGALIVVGGTIAVLFMGFPVKEILRTLAQLKDTLSRRSVTPERAMREVVTVAGRLRTRAVNQPLRERLAGLKTHPFFREAIELVFDAGGSDGAFEEVMEAELATARLRRERAAAILRRAGEVAPAFGLIGTLVGLVEMLAQLESPERLGPAMALALLTTLYGALLAHVVFLPLADRLERLAEEEDLVRRIYAIGARAIGRREHPEQLARLLKGLVAAGPATATG